MYMTKVKIAAVLLLAASLGMGAVLYAPGAQAEPRTEEKVSSPPVDSAAAPKAKAAEMPPVDAPTARQLIDYLNANAQRIPALRCRNVAIDVKDGRMSVGLAGKFLYQKPGQFRLSAIVLGKPAFDMGGNRDEIWYWISKNDPPYVFWISRADLARDKARWPLPLSPDWLREVLGVAERDANKRQEVVIKAKTIELIESVVTPQGHHARKVTVFARAQSPLQVVEHRLLDDKGNIVYRAAIRKVRRDEKTDALLVQNVHFVWPAQRLEASLQFNDMEIVEPMNDEKASRVFTSKDLGASRFCLATSQVEKKKVEPKPAFADSLIQIDLTNAHIEMRCHEETMKVSGQPGEPLSLQVLKDQLQTWIAANGKQAPSLRITCEASVEYAKVKTILDACRQAGIRKIELRTSKNSESKAVGK